MPGACAAMQVALRLGPYRHQPAERFEHDLDQMVK